MRYGTRADARSVNLQSWATAGQTAGLTLHTLTDMFDCVSASHDNKMRCPKSDAAGGAWVRPTGCGTTQSQVHTKHKLWCN